jgi:hypothetical protein
VNPYVAFGVGVGVGALGVTILYASLAPAVSERVVVEAVTGGATELAIPGMLSQGIALPLGRRVRRLVASKVAPWTL